VTVRRAKIAVAVMVLAGVALLGWGFVRLQLNVNSYDQRVADCVEVRKSWLPPSQRYFTDENYQQMFRDCEKQQEDS
jgi:hypothetical protein